MSSHAEHGFRAMALALIAGGLAAVGCGENGGATVSGKVTSGGRPVANGSVSFIAQGKPGAYARLQSDGSYVLVNHEQGERIEPGSYAVVIVVNRSLVDPKSAEKGLGVPISVTNQATTPLRYAVVEGANTIDIDLDKLPKKNQ